MSKVLRKIIQIDEEKCDGCGNCIPSCAEGALAIVDGKARIVKDLYCDGLGACLGHCPQDALKVIEREAEEFDEEAAMEHVRRTAEAEKAGARKVAQGCPGGKVEVFDKPAAKSELQAMPKAMPQSMTKTMGCGCPGSMIQDFSSERPAPVAQGELSGGCPCSGGKFARQPSPKSEPRQDPAQSELTHWPVQLRLIPSHAPFLKDANLLLAADCVPAAYPRFHEELLKGRKVLIGCPKFDDARDYVQRLAAIFRDARPRGLTIARMEVPCCGTLTQIVDAALRVSGVDVPVKEMVITRQGKAVEQDRLAAQF